MPPLSMQEQRKLRACELPKKGSRTPPTVVKKTSRVVRRLVRLVHRRPCTLSLLHQTEIVQEPVIDNDLEVSR
jgi:hypothetical protein